ncbi:MAG TPA: PIN domain-containing protein, partial [Candidatus Paceibacterota bacterium]|nr:PIN domain-containing protein [Candidatus Paceibacterota bacterium]
LVDVNVLSEPTQPAPNAKVVGWLNAHEADLIVDSIILGEMCLGVLSLPSGRKRARLETWFEAVAQTLQCLPWDAAVCRRWARLVSELRRKGLAMPVLDAMIAATALEHGLTIATRNVSDFHKAGVPVVDPFA